MILTGTLETAYRRYTGPTCFAIPGNHDWIDGLYTYMEFIVNRVRQGGKGVTSSDVCMVIFPRPGFQKKKNI